MNIYSIFQAIFNAQPLTLNQQAAILFDLVMTHPNSLHKPQSDYDQYWLDSKRDGTKGLLLQVSKWNNCNKYSLCIQGASSVKLSPNSRIDFYGNYDEFMSFLFRAF